MNLFSLLLFTLWMNEDSYLLYILYIFDFRHIIDETQFILVHPHRLLKRSSQNFHKRIAIDNKSDVEESNSIRL